MASKNSTTQSNPGGPWGAYPFPDVLPGFRPYGFAIVQTDGTLINASGNLTVVHASTGNYIMRPAVQLTQAQSLAMAIANGATPFVPSITYGIGPDSWDLQVTWFNSASQAAVDANFTFLLWLAN